MVGYILRRVLQGIPTLVGVSLLSFFLIRSAPGDPIEIMMFSPDISMQTRQALRRAFELDQPIIIQYLSWMTGITVHEGDMVDQQTTHHIRCCYSSYLGFALCDNGGGVLRGQLGMSIASRQPVSRLIAQRIPLTVELTATGLLLGLLFGVPLGALSAVYRDSLLDNLTRVLAVIGNSIPAFWMGLILIFSFGVRLKWFPTGGRQTLSLTDSLDLLDWLRHLTLPCMTLAFAWVALLSRYMRTEMLEVIGSDYIRTAWAKGVHPGRIWYVHALRNALIPLMTILGPAITQLLAGAVIIETIFSWPGMGRLAFDAALQRDYPVVLGIVMISSVLAILGNLLSDILYGVVDPRVRLA